MKEYKDILFKEAGGHGLYMDITVPETEEKPPVIMWIHGGGWNQLKKNWSLVGNMPEKGYAVASVEYRYCDEAPFPAQMYDLKDALLFIRKHADEYGYDGSRLIVSGDSAGSHMACLIGVSAGNRAWEKEGEDYSVQAVVDFCGPTWIADLKNGPDAPAGSMLPMETFLNVPADSKEWYQRAAEASPETYVNGTEPPFLIVHGSIDPVVPRSHAIKMRNALEAAGDTVHMYLVPGGVHAMGGALLDSVVAEFLDYYMKDIKTIEEPKVLDCHMRDLPLRINMDTVSRRKAHSMALKYGSRRED